MGRLSEKGATQDQYSFCYGYMENQKGITTGRIELDSFKQPKAHT